MVRAKHFLIRRSFVILLPHSGGPSTTDVRTYDWLRVAVPTDVRFADHEGSRYWDGLAMRRRAIAAWLTAVVALSAAVRRADDPTSSSPSSATTSGAKHDRRVSMGDHVTLTQRYINGKLDELETRLGRRLAEQAKRLNQSITIHYLEKVSLTNAKLSASC